MKKVIKRLLTVALLILILLPVIIYISITFVNNGIAYNTLKDLKNIELPPNTKIQSSHWQAGKLVGNGNEMQYFGSIVVSSDLCEDELEEYYKSFDKYIDVEDLQNNNDYKITLQGNRNPENEFINFLLDFDIRGH